MSAEQTSSDDNKAEKKSDESVTPPTDVEDKTKKEKEEKSLHAKKVLKVYNCLIESIFTFSLMQISNSGYCVNI